MKDENPVAMLARHSLTQHVLFAAFLVCSAVIWWPFLAYAEDYPKLPLRRIGQGLGALSLVCSWLFANGISKQLLTDESMPLKAAFLHTFYGYMAMLSFLPLVGPYFHRVFEEKKPKNPLLDR